MENKFGEFVKAKRQEKEISLRKLAEELGIVPAYMSDIEKGSIRQTKTKSIKSLRCWVSTKMTQIRYSTTLPSQEITAYLLIYLTM